MTETKHRQASQQPQRRLAALIVAAGNGSRMAADGTNPDVPKQFMILGDRPVLAHSLDAFATHDAVVSIAVVTAADQTDRVQQIATDLLQDSQSTVPVQIVTGGATRQDSVRAGLRALQGSGAEMVAIHDAARPLLTHEMIDRLMTAMSDDIAAALPVLPIADTIKTTATDAVTGTIDRSNAAAAQTPQLFMMDDICKRHEDNSGNTTFTDDISLLEESGAAIAAVPGSQYLMKITRETDMVMVRALLAHQDTGFQNNSKNGPKNSPQGAVEQVMTNNHTIADIRVGNGYDVHKFSDASGPIMLAGISVPSERGMSAHSDGDVGLHALCDAIFGALADGDIGFHFPPSDAQWKDADSAQFLEYAMKRCADRSAVITSLDLTIICEYPKITPHRDAMRTRIASITGLAIDRIGVKATTSEGLGFTGRREGIAAQATATLYFPPSRG